jgi:hypothetical protein
MQLLIVGLEAPLQTDFSESTSEASFAGLRLGVLQASDIYKLTPK